MGIAGFFLWLQRFYGRAIVEIDTELGNLPLAPPPIEPEDDPTSPILPAPPPPTVRGGGGGGGSRRFEPRKVKGVDVDNLYLDMNGLIHPCCHDCAPRAEPESEDEMITRIFEAVDKLVTLVKPKKILYMAIDGVAPRSKMNQQRARRFRSAAEREEANTIASRMADIVVETHRLPRPEHKEKWDHNVITPATAFMDRVGTALEWYVSKRLNSNDPLWEHLTVVLSDAHVPGEGEHKIMQYIRTARAQPGYDPNTRHMIHGQDADLIMLGLATHEFHFTVLRNVLNENFQPDADRFCVFDVGVFRSCLKKDYAALGDVDFERVIDDFVFLCFFIGNDFLPHMPLVDIKCKGIETMLDHYVRNYAAFGFLTNSGVINFDRLQVFVATFTEARIEELLTLKDTIHRRAEQAAERMVQKVQEDREEIARTLARVKPGDETSAKEVGGHIFKLYVDIAKEQLRLVAGKFPLPFVYGEKNYRDEYYQSRFGWELADPKSGTETARSRADFERGVMSCVHEYLKGMQWVMLYYTSGCPSWEWFYPYHYAPLLQDVARYCRGDIDTKMHLGEPLHPVEQLLAVLPRESVNALPPELHDAVLDQKSVLAKFYPDDFTVDYSEAIHSWQGVIQLPFVNCKRLQKAVREVAHLSPDEGWTLVFCRRSSATAKSIERLLGPLPRIATQSVSDLSTAAKAAMRPVSASLASVTPLAGKIGRFPFAPPPGARIDCPDKGIVERDASGMGQCIPLNDVAVYQCEFPPFVKYIPALLRGVRHETHESRLGGTVRSRDEAPEPAQERRPQPRARDRSRTSSNHTRGLLESPRHRQVSQLPPPPLPPLMPQRPHRGRR